MGITSDTPGRLFFRTCGIILLFTASAKLLSTLGESQYLVMPAFTDFLTNRQLYFGAGVLELCVASVLLGKSGFHVKLLTTAWVSTCFVAWRVGLKLGHYKLCPCLGNAYQWLPLSEISINRFLLAVLVFMFLGSYAMLIQALIGRWRSCTLPQRPPLP